MQDGVRVALRLQPGAGANRIEQAGPAADGVVRLKVRVTQPAEAGKANQAMVRLLAKSWRLPARSLELVSGAKARNKAVLVRGETGTLMRMLDDWLEGR